MDIYKLIYKRAKEKGIYIEQNPKHKLNKDYIGSGRRNVIFPGSKKIYSYAGSLIEIALKLNLISEEEYNNHLIKNGWVYCNHCRCWTPAEYVRLTGRCSNCPAKLKEVGR